MYLKKVEHWQSWDFETIMEDANYLCKADGKLFVSKVSFLENPDNSMPANYAGGCLYVDSGKKCYPMDKLTEIWYIAES